MAGAHSCWRSWLAGIVMLAAQASVAEDAVRFPLASGNLWQYRLTSSWRATMDDATSSFDSLQTASTVTWQIGSEEEVLGQRAFPMTVTQRILAGPDSARVGSAVAWYVARGDTLQAIASRLGPSSVQVEAFLFKPARLGQALDPDPWHFLCLVYPLEVGRSWVPGNAIVAHSGTGSEIRSVDAVETVRVPAGTYTAYRVVYLLRDLGLEWRVEQWFASVGLVQMRSLWVGREDRTDEQGNLVGTMTSTTAIEMVLERSQLRAPDTSLQAIVWGSVKARGH